MVTASFDERKRVLELRDDVVRNFTAADWTELGILTGFTTEIRQHDRLLRSLSWGDPDYSGHALDFLLRMADGGWRMADGGWRMADRDARYIGTIEAYLSEKYEISGENVSSVKQKGSDIILPQRYSIAPPYRRTPH